MGRLSWWMPLIKAWWVCVFPVMAIHLMWDSSPDWVFGVVVPWYIIVGWKADDWFPNED